MLCLPIYTKQNLGIKYYLLIVADPFGRPLPLIEGSRIGIEGLVSIQF